MLHIGQSFSAFCSASLIRHPLLASLCRAAPFLRRSQWEDLKSCKKNYRTKRALDRRFDGPKDRRTRDYSSDSSDDYDKDYGDY